MQSLIKKLVLSLFFSILAIQMIPVQAFEQDQISLDLSINDDEGIEVLEGSHTYEFLVDIDTNDLLIEDSNGNLIDDGLHEIIIGKILEKDFDGVVDLVFQYNLSLVVEVIEESPSRSVSHTSNFERFQSHTQLSLCGRTRAQWISILRGTLTYNNNGTITPNGTPRLTVDTFMGTGWSVSVTNISTGYTRIENNRAVNAWGSYDLSATFFEWNVPFMTRNWGRISTSQRIA